MSVSHRYYPLQVDKKREHLMRCSQEVYLEGDFLLKKNKLLAHIQKNGVKIIGAS